MNHIFRLSSFVRPYWKRAVLALVLLSSLVVMDLSIPRLIQRIIDQGIDQHDMTVVATTAALMIFLSLLSAVIAIGNNYFSVQVGEGVARDVREALFLKIQSFSYGNLDRQHTGPLMTRLTSDVAALKTLTQITLRIGTRGPLLMIGSVLLMFLTNSRLALTLLPLLVVTAAIIVLFIVNLEPLFLGVQQRLDRLNNVLQENIAGVRLVRAFVRAATPGRRGPPRPSAWTKCSRPFPKSATIRTPPRFPPAPAGGWFSRTSPSATTPKAANSSCARSI